MTWMLVNILNKNGKETHVIPVDDLREHVELASCWCSPELDDELMLAVHNSADNREAFETKERKPS